MGFWDSINNMINTVNAGYFVDAMQELEGTGFPTYKYRGNANGDMTVTPEQKNEFMNDVLTRLKEIDKELYEIERDYKI